MLTKVKSNDQSLKSRCFGQKRKFKFLSKMTRSGPTSSPYQRMDDDVKEVKKLKKKAKKSEMEESSKDKENKEVKDKKKSKKTWKLIRQATLCTCRYIGLGVAHMSPVAAYGSADYYIDPKLWNKSFSTSCKTKPPPTHAPHWTNTMMFSSW